MPSHACHLFAVVGGCRNRSRDVSAVSVTVHGIVIVAAEVPSVHVVHEAVLVIVLPVPGNLTRIGPEVALQVRVPVVDAGVDYCNRHRT